MTCPHCGETARRVGWREKGIPCLPGAMRLGRHYYHCAARGQGHFPWDATPRTTDQRLTPGARAVVCLTGTRASFGQAAERTLRELTGLRPCEATVERTTAATGTRPKERQQDGLPPGAGRRCAWNVDAEGRRCAYVSLDATGILMQGEGGSKVDGRMATAGMLFNPQPRAADEEALSKPCAGVRYFAGFYDLDALGAQMRLQGGQVGMSDAEQWMALTDGGAGLGRFIDVHFPPAEKILDFHHAAEPLSAFAKLYRPGRGAAALPAAWRHALKCAGGRHVIRMPERLPRARMADEVAAEQDRLLNDLRNNAHRTDYPRYRRRGWQIAGGALGAACKRVINRRLCTGGMRRGEAGSDGVAHLRAPYLSDADQWDDFWAAAA